MAEQDKTKPKVLFIRMEDGTLYERIAKQARKEDRSINKMAMILLKKGLETVEEEKVSDL